MASLRRSVKKLVGWFPTLFWGGMLLGHLPLILRAAYRLGTGVETLSSGKSLLTLLLASAFFIFKLRGGRILQTRPDIYQIVAFCLLGVFLHLFLFPPTVLDNPYEFVMLKCLAATVVGVSLIVLFHLIRWSRRVVIRPNTFTRFSHLFRRMRREPVWIVPIPAYLAVPSNGVIRRGPPSLLFRR